ncbi:alpha/beta-type small acid-soluble spore protein [Mesobacillus subterraneus]|jgi:small acid-soluble spore protein D (minor alpha/beta-type SASP)|uniref:alpha/beta-type small acid-soluble spore protein n=1 Tax=Mesobacillus subterraneus TaxID=285983 RepID=UPI00203D62E4|nr:alpha/beta-type small acid-soluble spore protein [Mesobacillus subterraneus]MCM3667059.1 alpha/beta-type small acid-soluble spore protein [Mesobacillus subterraneus]MCM3685022.1 alpha/beta-type small acid-soluble spore protein [Mesobacillus subterraneus]
MARRNKILVPEARQALDDLKAQVAGTMKAEDAKFETAKEIGVPLTKGDNGGLTTREAGKVGGRLGGGMVRELVKMAQESLRKQ